MVASQTAGAGARGDRERSATAQRIHDAAITLFAERGYDATGMRDIARAAEVNLAAINYCYGSKAGLLSELVGEFFAGYKAAALSSYDPNLDVTEQCRALVRAVTNYARANSQLVRIAVSQLPLDNPEIAAEKAAHVEAMARDLRERLLRPLLGAGADRVPITLMGPALTAMVTSGEQFGPMIVRLSEELHRPAQGWDYSEAIATLAAEGMPGLMRRAADADPGGDSSPGSGSAESA